MLDQGIGKKVWAFAAGHIPIHSNGKEPEFASHDKISVLNTSEKEIEIALTIFYENEKPVRNYSIRIQARRIRKIRFNDLVDPLPIPLDKPFGFLLTCNAEIVVQFSRMNTGSKQLAAFCVTPFFRQ